jgi:Ca2+-binding RTX toxin-like protein
MSTLDEILASNQTRFEDFAGMVSGSQSADTLSGSANSELILGGAGADTIRAGAGDDLVVGTPAGAVTCRWSRDAEGRLVRTWHHRPGRASAEAAEPLSLTFAA